MADRVTNKTTSLQSEDAIVRAVQFFSTEKFRASSQTGRTATFDGRPPIPWFMLLCTIVGFALCVVPGVIMYFLVIRKVRRFHNLVVTATPLSLGTQISVSHPDWAAKQVTRFLAALPGVTTPAPTV